jgi:hypothetical protein
LLKTKELDDEEYEANVLAGAAALGRSKRLKDSATDSRSSPNLGSGGSGGESPIAPVSRDLHLLAQEEEDEEEMRMMMKSDQHEYDDDQFDDDEDLVASNRTTPNPISGGNKDGNGINLSNTAPLTRQLLTESEYYIKTTVFYQLAPEFLCSFYS